ncbi:isochorismatase family protein [Hansschlegelia quercus]|uniref:Isochorismatase family protein n=1 Tax=Hansschlegelia quercus TaxID=2528245 RepID=A0A4Q9GKD0_9HYPH|nr:isochorismatase family protein [Hansschlegelia quercus]TBN54648.1 isochorismatase family protein [Hansschlegelia quercus]
MSDFAGALRERLPVARRSYDLPKRTGLVIVDAVNGFCTPGAGPLAPIAPDAAIDGMLSEIAALARRFLDEQRPVLALCDTHEPGRPEPPYPPHCERGTGQEKLAPALSFLERKPGARIVEKDVIDGYVGTTLADGSNILVEWIRAAELESVMITGICTDICDLDLVSTLLSARNHYMGGRPMLGPLKDVVLYEPGCATYDLAGDVAAKLGLPETAAHPQAETHHIGLYVMQARGAVIADRLRG